MKSSIPEAKFAKGVFQIQSPISVVNFSNNISKTQIRVNEWKKYLYSTFRTLQPLTSNHASSDHKTRCKTTYQKFAQNILVPHAKLFYYKGSTIFCRGRGDTMLYLQIFSHFWKFIPNFWGTNYELSSKTTKPLFLKSYSMVLKFSKPF